MYEGTYVLSSAQSSVADPRLSNLEPDLDRIRILRDLELEGNFLFPY